jgi:hypothetical protein
MGRRASRLGIATSRVVSLPSSFAATSEIEQSTKSREQSSVKARYRRRRCSPSPQGPRRNQSSSPRRPSSTSSAMCRSTWRSKFGGRKDDGRLDNR